MRCRTAFWIGSAVICVGGVSIVTQTAAEPQESATTPQRVHELVQRIEKLEARVAKLEKTRPFLLAPRRAQSPPDRQRIPEGWVPKEFNGQYYYIVPLDSRDQKAKPAARLPASPARGRR